MTNKTKSPTRAAAAENMGERIRAGRKSMQLTQAALGKLIGVDQSAVTAWEKGKNTPRHPSLVDLARVLHTSPEYLLFGETGQGIAPRPPVAVTGILQRADEVQDVPYRANRTVPAPPAGGGPDDELPSATGAVAVRGNGMWPVYRDGDVLYYAETGQRPEQLVGNECVVRLENGTRLLRRLMPGPAPGLFTLAAYNGPELVGAAVTWAAPILWIRRGLVQPEQQPAAS